MPHQDKSQKCYLDQGINLEWPNNDTQQLYLILIFLTFSGHNSIMLLILVVQLNLKLVVLRIADRFAECDGLKKMK